MDYYHLKKAASRPIRDKTQANNMVTTLRSSGFEAVRGDLRKRIDQADGKRKQQLEEFYCYIHNHQDVLLDLEQTWNLNSSLSWSYGR